MWASVRAHIFADSVRERFHGGCLKKNTTIKQVKINRERQSACAEIGCRCMDVYGLNPTEFS